MLTTTFLVPLIMYICAVVKTYLIRLLTSNFTKCTLTISVKSFFLHTLIQTKPLKKSYQLLYISYIVLKALYKNRSNK